MKHLIYGIGIAGSMFYVPLHVLAHGTEEEHQREIFMQNLIRYGFITSIAVFIILIAAWFLVRRRMKSLNVKKKEERIQRNKLEKAGKAVGLTSLLPLVMGVILGWMSASPISEGVVNFHHIHGLDYTSDGKEIFVPAHDGLKIYKDGAWQSHEEGEKHDYMGFSMAEDGFYSSGHPAPGSKMENPFGIVKSTDKGKTLQILDLYKEIDFHGLTVGYRTKDIYVFNPEPNSRMNEPGFYYSTDETKTWNKSKLEGIQGQPTTLTAHPTESGIVAIGTDKGGFISNDFGNTFDAVLPDVMVAAISFTHDNAVLVGITGKLLRLSLDGTSQSDLNIPPLDKDDAIAYVKQNPQDPNEYVFATYNKDIYMTKDSGKSWVQTVKKGIASNQD
ncbi:F510_1955 family glycosylhydrolase [Ammoniphilus sp. YIM 78166]|uniref:F510_1955 family glycosylhydrolase n=1 Tax=Ammoniphilus sp. YIM 78166 TaxID=1644106 RepID=UPI00107068E9|nr:glycosyl hydrolase [Ammoniphilus sp. YIM 78166]